MTRTSTYLNFTRETEEAFNFYKKVFNAEFGTISRFSDMPAGPDGKEMKDEDKNLVLHIELPILGGHILMGSDVPESMGQIKFGNNVYLNLEPDSREEADKLFRELSAGGKIEMEMQDMFWGAYFGSFSDKFGVKWMINLPAELA